MDLNVQAPMNMLKVLAGENVNVYLAENQQCRGELVDYDEMLNVQLRDVYYQYDGKQRHFDNMIIHGSNIEYITKCVD